MSNYSFLSIDEPVARVKTRIMRLTGPDFT
jgi:hypothetical protein